MIEAGDFFVLILILMYSNFCQVSTAQNKLFNNVTKRTI